MIQWTPEEVRSVMEKVIERSTTDADFRKLCLENPKEAIKEFAEKEIPDNFDIKMIENKATVTIVLPDFKGAEG
ncbi:MAG: hypothetical protein WBI74_05265 [Caldicoprobacterales bacterium]|jgi:cephalosporin hydroxylase|nr:hypothetical protein [Clostridiales bacterium]